MLIERRVASMARIHPFVVPVVLLALIAGAAPMSAAGGDSDAAARSDGFPRPGGSGPAQPMPPPHAPAQLPAMPDPPGSMSRWLDEVRAQRRALQDMRRAHQDARKDEFLRRRHEMLDRMESDRRLFRNRGPWLEPLPPATLPPSLEPPEHGIADHDDDASGDGHHYPPPGWDNGWYYNGW
jgi:hypothetical protein